MSSLVGLDKREGVRKEWVQWSKRGTFSKFYGSINLIVYLFLVTFILFPELPNYLVVELSHLYVELMSLPKD